MTFIQLKDFMIYQHVSKRTKILPLATSHIAHLCNQFNRAALPFSMPRFKNISFIKIALKLSYFCKKKCKIFKRWGLCPHTYVPSASGGFAPRPPIVSGGWGVSPPHPHCEFLATRLVLHNIETQVIRHIALCYQNQSQ